MKVEVIYKFLLICLLVTGLCGVLISGVAILLGWRVPNLMDCHLIFAALLVGGLLLHVFNRRNKLAKTLTQFSDLIFHNRYPSYCSLDRLLMTFEHFSIVQIAEQLQLSLPLLMKELALGKIEFKDTKQSLRSNFPHNDEKIFAVVTITLKLRFTTNLKGFEHEKNAAL